MSIALQVKKKNSMCNLKIIYVISFLQSLWIIFVDDWQFCIFNITRNYENEKEWQNCLDNFCPISKLNENEMKLQHNKTSKFVRCMLNTICSMCKVVNIHSTCICVCVSVIRNVCALEPAHTHTQFHCVEKFNALNRVTFC